jgi:hypothetical protein
MHEIVCVRYRLCDYLVMLANPVLCNLPLWTETNAAWAQAIGVFAAFAGQLVLLALTLREQRAARLERYQNEIRRQRSEVTCSGVTLALRSLPDDKMITHLWAGHFRHAGFAFDVSLYHQLPEYLRRKCEPFEEDMNKPRPEHFYKTTRSLLVYKFPFPEFDAILEDVYRLNFDGCLFVWDDHGNPIQIR